MRTQPHSASEPTHRELSFDEKLKKIQKYSEGITEKILSQRDRIEGEPETGHRDVL